MKNWKQMNKKPCTHPWDAQDFKHAQCKLEAMLKMMLKKEWLWVNASYSGSFQVDVELPKLFSMFLYIIHMDMVLNSIISLV